MNQIGWKRKGALFAWLSLGIAGLAVLLAATPGRTQGLVAYYPFNGNGDDASGSGNPATPVNVVSCPDRNGVDGQAYRFSGSQSYVRYPDSVFGPSTTGFTWSIWANPDPGVDPNNAAGGWYVMNHGAINGEAALAWTGSSYSFGINFANSSWKSVSASCGQGLTHIVCVYQRGSRAEVWINGVLSGSFVPPNEDLFVLQGFPNYSSIGTYYCNTGAQFCFKGVLDDVRIYNRALSAGEVEQLYSSESPVQASGTGLVVQQGDPAPGISGAKFASIGIPAMNHLLHVAFQASVTGTNPVTTALIGHNNVGIWADDSTGALQMIARAGALAPGTQGGRFSDFSDPVSNNNDRVAFLGELNSRAGDVIASGNQANNLGVWANDGGALHLVARKGQQAPGCDAGVAFSSFEQIALPDQGGLGNSGGVVLLASIIGKGISQSANHGIWAVDSNGQLQLIIRGGAVLGGKTVRALEFLAPAPGVTGQTRSFAQSTGDLLYKATFADRSWGVYKVVFP